MKVHYFNPGYEAAIEKGSCNYTPPIMVQQLRRDLQTLPLYYADVNEEVFISSPLPDDLLCKRLIDNKEQVFELLPWGWSPDLKSSFPNINLPYSLEEMKLFGSRSLSIELWHAVYQKAPNLFLYHPPKEVSIGGEVEPGEWVLKEDYTSSGRGVEFINARQNPKIIISRRFGVKKGKRLFIEPFYHIKEERGYEFWRSEEGEITYIGNHKAIIERGRYKGSSIGESSDDDREYIDSLIGGLTTLPLGSYSGVIGVDTAIYQDESVERFVPCFEVNVRPTMGYVAICIERDWLAKGQRGRFMILSKDDDLVQSVNTKQPLYLNENKGGLTPDNYLLTPLLPDTYFVACLLVY